MLRSLVGSEMCIRDRCETLEVSNIKTAGVPNHNVKTLIIDIKSDERYFERSIHHELFHMADDSYDNLFSYDKWEKFNILDFQYAECSTCSNRSDLSLIQDSNGFKGNQIAFNSDGSMIHASSYFGQTSTGELFSGVPVLPTHDSDDIFVAKRGIDKEWDWVRTIRLCSGFVIDLEIDDSDNIYVLTQYQGMTSSNCDVRFSESPSFDFESNNKQDIFVAKYDTNGNLLWVTNSDSPQTPASNRNFVPTYNSGLSVDSSGSVSYTHLTLPTKA